MKTWLIDMDDTLLDTSRWLIPQAAEKACLFLINNGLQVPLEELLTLRAQWGIHLSHRLLFIELIQHFQVEPISETQIKIGQEAANIFYEPAIPAHLPMMQFAQEILETYKNSRNLYLITSGKPLVQKEKVKALKCTQYFKKIYLVDSAYKEKKFECFKAILRDDNLHPEEVLCIGNRLTQEIRDAKLLRIKTCYLAHGEHKGEQPSRRTEVPDWVIESWDEFKKLQDSHGF